MAEPDAQEAEPGPRRRRDWDGVAAIIAALVGLLALCVSGYTAYIQRQQVRAQVWPYLEPGMSSARREVELFNKGVGPAIVRSVRIYADGRPQRDWSHLYASLGLKFAHNPPYSTINGVVISPNDRIDQLVFDSSDDFNAFVAQKSRVQMQICYCSTLDECWMYDERESDRSRLYRQVDACPVSSTNDFIDNETAEPAVPKKEGP